MSTLLNCMFDSSVVEIMSTHISCIFDSSVVETVETRWGHCAVGDHDDTLDRHRPVARCLRIQFRGRISLQLPIQQALLIVAAQEHACWLQSWLHSWADIPVAQGIHTARSSWRARLDELLLRILQSQSVSASLEWLLNELMASFDAVEVAHYSLELSWNTQ